MKLLKSVYIALALILLVGCSFNNDSKRDDHTKSTTVHINPEYAEWFFIEQNENYKKLVIKDPWNEGRNLAEYFLVNRNSYNPNDSLQNTIQVPVKNVVALTSAYIGFLKELNSLDVLTGVSGRTFVYSQDVLDQIDRGKTFVFGEEESLQWEKLINHSPDALFVTAFPGHNPVEKYKDLGINAVYMAGWQEKTPLARAEWIKVIGLFLGKEKQANELFEKIENDYLYLQTLTENLDKTKVLDGFAFKGIWYLPGGESYKARFYEDAGANYVYQNDKEYGSISKDFETIIEDGHDAEVWFYPRMSKRDIRTVMDEDQLKVFKAYRKQKIYYQNARLNPEGGNDYWESGPARPDLVLKDLISILHPGLIPDHKLHFFNNNFE